MDEEKVIDGQTTKKGNPVKKEIVKREYRLVSLPGSYMSAGSGLGEKVRKLFVTCRCGKRMQASSWKRHDCDAKKK